MDQSSSSTATRQTRRSKGHATNASVSSTTSSSSSSSSSLIMGTGQRIVTAGLVVYGTYALANWVWKNYHGIDEQDEEQQQYHQHDTSSNQHSADQDQSTTSWTNAIRDAISTTITRTFLGEHGAAGGSSLLREGQGYHQQQQQNSGTTSWSSSGNSNSRGSRRRQWKVRQQRIAKCRHEVTKALEGLLPTMRRQIEDYTSTLKETKELKQLRTKKKMKANKQPKQQQEEEKKHHGVGNEEEQDQQEEGIDTNWNDILRQEEERIWKIIQVQMVTRMIATAYAHTILFLVLTVQVHLMGGKLMEEQMKQVVFDTKNTTTTTSTDNNNNSSSSSNSNATISSDSYLAIHRFVLMHTYDYFFEYGLNSLMNTIHTATQYVIADWNVLDREYLYMSRERLEQAITTIRTIVEEDTLLVTISSNQQRHRHGSTTTRPRSLRRSLMRFLIPPSTLVIDDYIHPSRQEDELALDVLDETWDILESPVLWDAQQNCMKLTFDIMRDYGWGEMFEPALPLNDDEKQTIVETVVSHERTNKNDPNKEIRKGSLSSWTTKPLANVVTNLKHSSNSFYVQGHHQDHSTGVQNNLLVTAQGVAHTPSYYARMEMLPSVLELADVSFN